MERREFFKALPALFLAPFQDAESPIEEKIGSIEKRQTDTEFVLFVHGVVLENHREHIERLDNLHPQHGKSESGGVL